MPIRPAPRTTPEPEPEGDDVGGLASELESGVQVAIDRWSSGQIGWTDVWIGLGIFVAATVLAFAVRRLIRHSTRTLDGSAAAAVNLLGQIVSIGLYLFAIALVLEVLGFTLGPVLIIALVVVVVLLVLRPVVTNVSSGLMLQLRGHCRPGDVVDIGGEVGVVSEVNTRAVVLETADGRTVALPNDGVISGKLVNLSRLGRRRSHVTVRLPGDIDVDLVTERVVDAISAAPTVLEDPAPRVMVTGFDGTQIWIEVQYWSLPDIESELKARDEVGRALCDVFNAEVRLSDSSSIVHVTSM
ncbi:MAG: mechanosensitive ion channel family protein [Ilumatobacteraceae bacterium]